MFGFSKEEKLINFSAQGDIQSAEKLISGGVDVNASDRKGFTALLAACDNLQYPTIDFLLSNGASRSSKTKNGNTALILASARGCDNAGVFKYFETQLNECNSDGVTPLLAAIANGRTPTIKYLVENGADIDLCDVYGNSPCLASVTFKNLEALQLLVSRGANLDFVNKFGIFPLLKAACENQVQYVNVLLSGGANTEVANSKGATTLIEACELGYLNVVKALLVYGANINAQDEVGATALMASIYQNNKGLAALLIERGADLSIKSNGGVDALQQAKNDGDDSMLELIERSISANSGKFRS